MNKSSAVIDLSAVLIKIALIMNGAKGPRPRAGRIASMESRVVSEAREGVMTPVMMIVSVCLLRRIVVVRRIHAKELADAIADGGGAIARILVCIGMGGGAGVGAGVVGVCGVGILWDMIRRLGGVVVYGVVGSVLGIVMGRVMMARVLCGDES